MPKATKNKPKITFKQEVFIYEYLRDMNGRQAYKRAYGEDISDEVADSAASRLLSMVKVKAIIDTEKERILEKYGISTEKIIREYAKLGFANIDDFLEFNEDGIKFKNSKDIDCSAISEVSCETTTVRTEAGTVPVEKTKMKMKMHDKKGSLDSLAKYKSLFVEKIEHSGIINFTDIARKAKENAAQRDNG